MYGYPIPYGHLLKTTLDGMIPTARQLLSYATKGPGILAFIREYLLKNTKISTNEPIKHYDYFNRRFLFLAVRWFIDYRAPESDTPQLSVKNHSKPRK